MATMTLLATFNGAPSIVDAGGPVGTTATGVTYANGSFTGAQGVVVDSTDVLKTTETGADLLAQVPIAAGAMAIRFRNDAAVGPEQGLVYVSNSATGGDTMALYLLPTSGTIRGMFRANNEVSPAFLDIAEHPARSQHHFAYLEWDGTATAMRLDGTTVTGTRSTPVGAYNTIHGIGFGMRPSTGGLQLGGLIDAVAFFDGPLTTVEQDFLRTTPDLWTWGMPLAIPGYIDVLPTSGTNGSAPVLTLP